MARQVGRGPGRYGRLAEDHSLGLSFVFAVLLGMGAGAWVDKQFSTGPWGILIGLAWGIGGAAKILVDAHRRMTRRD
ncbi:AtpZ/AtpI family protein [bacterium]|nr:AtpZ/AtpI family protein [bacterium]